MNKKNAFHKDLTQNLEKKVVFDYMVKCTCFLKSAIPLAFSFKQLYKSFIGSFSERHFFTKKKKKKKKE